MAKELAGSMPFPGHARVMKGEHATHLKPGKVKRKGANKHVSAMTRTDLVKGPLKVSAKKSSTSRKRTCVKA